MGPSDVLFLLQLKILISYPSAHDFMCEYVLWCNSTKTLLFDHPSIHPQQRQRHNSQSNLNKFNHLSILGRNPSLCHAVDRKRTLSLEEGIISANNSICQIVMIIYQTDYWISVVRQRVVSPKGTSAVDRRFRTVTRTPAANRKNELRTSESPIKHPLLGVDNTLVVKVACKPPLFGFHIIVVVRLPVII